MFYSLTGKIVNIDSSSVAIDCSGVAFNVNTSVNTLKSVASLGEIITVYTYLSVREDAMEIFGFSTQEELKFFKMLIGVSGVGPKAALAILSAFTTDLLAFCISSGDVKSMTKAQGIGTKTAQRIIVELKDKISKTMDTKAKVSAEDMLGIPNIMTGNNFDEAISALMGLGYSNAQATAAVGVLEPSLSVEELIKKALQNLSRR